jgi:hypothetical protein
VLSKRPDPRKAAVLIRRSFITEPRSASARLPSPDLPEQIVQRLVLRDNAFVLIAGVDDLRQVPDERAHDSTARC